MTQSSASPSQPLGGYAAQYKRMVAQLLRASPASPDPVAAEDQFITFFMHCWHLKDHVKNDTSLPQALRTTAEDLAHACPQLQACQAIANGLKHCVAKPATMTGGKAILAIADAPVVYHPLVQLPDGTEVRALDLAWDAYNRWNQVGRVVNAQVRSADAAAGQLGPAA